MTSSNDDSIEARLRIPVDGLTTHVDEATLGFATTQEVSPLEGTIGQDRALTALDFGLDVDAPGFNIFVAGNPGSGRNTTLSNVLRKLAASQPVPNDWVYVYNFSDSSRPRGISFPPGVGRAFSSAVSALLDDVKARIPRAFEGPEYQRRVDGALANVHAQHRQVTDAMVAEAKSRGVGLSLTEAGVVATPLGPDGEPLTPEQLDITSEDSAKLREAQKGIEEFVGQRISTLRTLEREAARARRQLDREIADYVLQALFAELRETYAEHQEALEYLNDVLEDMVKNVALFARQEHGGERPASLQEMMAEMAGGGDDSMIRYQVNMTRPGERRAELRWLPVLPRSPRAPAPA